MSKQAVIDLALSEVGYTEYPPNSNKTKYGQEYGLDGVPWCVILQWWIFNHAGERMAFFGGGKTASCGTLLRWYREQGLTVPVSDLSDVQTGDIVILNFSGTSDTQHCGLVVEVHFNTIITVEGNTSSSGSQDNGGAVLRKVRYKNQIVGICRPPYKQEETTMDDVTGHWAEQHIHWGMNLGILRGYADGTFHPDSSMTRAEVATVLHRYDAKVGAGYEQRLTALEEKIKALEDDVK